ncbi:MAG: hypothetical protein AAF846_19590 [Chloroflexota bacterium]
MPLTVTRQDAVLLLLSAMMVALFVFGAGASGFPLDDSWIHQVYGRNLALNGEWAFISGEPSAASTSPLYTVILATGYFLRIPYFLWTHLIGTLALALTAMIGTRMRRYILPESSLASWGVGIMLVSSWHLIWAAASGMETMIFGMLTLLLIYLAWREIEAERSQATQAVAMRGAIFGIVTALTALARPEGVVLGGIAALLMLIVRPQGTFQRVIIFGVGAAIGFGIMLSPYAWLNWQLTGSLLPNTANAKFEQHALLLELPYLLRYGRLSLAILVGGQILLIPGMIAYLWQQFSSKNRLHGLYFALPILWGLSHIAIYAARLPAAYQHGRYVLPTLPAFIFVGVMGTVWMIQQTRKQGDKSVFTLLRRVSVQTLAISAVAVTLAFVSIGLDAYRNDVAVINTEMIASAEYIRENIPHDELMAIHDIGAVGYFAPRDMIDIAGLVTPEIIPIVSDGDALWNYMEANGAQYLMAFPDQVPNANPDDPRLCRIFYTDSDITREIRGEGYSMAIYRLAYDATCEG